MALSTFPSLPRRLTRREPTLTVIHRNPATLTVCKSIANSEPAVSLSERDGFSAAAPTPGERFLENQRAHEANKMVKNELKQEKKKRKESVVRKVVDTSSVSCCYGCGAPLQTSDVDSPGFVDLVTYDLKKKHHQLRTIICGRCQLLSHGYMIVAVVGNGGYAGGKQFVSADELREKLSHLRHEKALIVKLVDIVDFNGSFLARVRDLVGANPIVLVITKIDLLPKGTDMNCIGDWVVEVTTKKKLNVLSVHLTSSESLDGVSGVASEIQKEKKGRDVYILGAANVGKSAFINALLKTMAERDPVAAAAQKYKPIQSAVPGTTLGPIQINAFLGAEKLYDTPGVHLHHRQAAVVHSDDLPAIAPQNRLRGQSFDISTLEEENYDDDLGLSVEALLLLQKSMLEKQWNLSFEKTATSESPSKKRTTRKKIPVTRSGISARQRRICAKKKTKMSHVSAVSEVSSGNQVRTVINSELFQDNRVKGYVKGVISEDMLSHAEVVRLSKKIKSGLRLDDHKSRLKDRLGCEPSDEQLAISLKISRAELQAWLMECHLAREKLAMSNVRLVMSIAQRYDNMGAEMSDLVQGGLIGLLRGIEKFDSSKGFRISTYVYWWIRQGVAKALVNNSRTLRLPTHLHERLGVIRNAKLRLQEKGITPSIDRIAESLNMSQKKVRNATEAVSKIFSLDRDAFPSLNGVPGETHHSYIADNRLENNPWHGYDEWALKDEVSKLISATLGEREREIIRLYYGLDKKCLTWEDISKRIGLSRERVRQVGLVALEKLKHAARKRKMEAMVLKN